MVELALSFKQLLLEVCDLSVFVGGLGSHLPHFVTVDGVRDHSCVLAHLPLLDLVSQLGNFLLSVRDFPLQLVELTDSLVEDTALLLVLLPQLVL